MIIKKPIKTNYEHGGERRMDGSLDGDCKRVGSSAVVKWAHLIDVFVSAALFPRFIFPHPQNRTKNRYSERPPYLRFMTFLLVFPQLGLELITFLKRLLLRRFGFYCRFPNEFIIQILLLSKAYLPGFVKFVIKLFIIY